MPTSLLSLQEAQIDQFNVQKQEILEKCELEQISLPIILDPMDTDSSVAAPSFHTYKPLTIQIIEVLF